MKTFKQVFINSEADLPKEIGYYFVRYKDANIAVVHWHNNAQQWLKFYDWYLIEAPDNRDAIIEKQREMMDFLLEHSLQLPFTPDERIRYKKLRAELSALEAPPEDK